MIGDVMVVGIAISAGADADVVVEGGSTTDTLSTLKVPVEETSK